MNQTTTSHSRISLPVSLSDLAESIWHLPSKEREALEDLLEKQFVRTVLRRAKEIPRLRKTGKLISLEELKRGFPR